MNVLGLHGGWRSTQHDASACVIIDGRPVALCEEERYTRLKGSYGQMPNLCILAALKMARLTWQDIDLVVVPGVTYADGATRWLHYLTQLMESAPQHFLRVHHQEAHAASAYYGSGYQEAIVISLDNRGDGQSGCVMQGRGTDLKLLNYFPVEESLGAFYTKMTEYCGFANGDEYKLMGLAPYGTPRYASLDPLPHPPRSPHGALTEYDKDIAASTQAVFESKLLQQIAIWQSSSSVLCYAGGVALNCKANALLFDNFKHVYISPIAGDRGLSLGCAYLGAKSIGDIPRPLLSPYLGTDYTNNEIIQECKANGIKYHVVEEPFREAAEMIAREKVIGWFQGRAEAGARALGNRSILANAASPDMRNHVNNKIKHREEFRPFAPAIIWEQAATHFEISQPSPYMTITFRTKTSLPAVTHVDGTSRVQTVRSSDNALFYALVKEAGGVVLNTSFNLKGQPIVETPRDAIMTFYGSGLDALFMGNVRVVK